MTHNDAIMTQKQRASFATKHYYINGCENNGLPPVTYNGLKPLARLGWEASDVRFTFSESTRRQVLQRLLKLNHERYADEEKKVSTKKATAKKKANCKSEEATLFDQEDQE